MAGPSLVIPIGADITKFQSSMTEVNLTAANVTRAVTAATIKMSAGFLASQGAAGAATLAFGRLLGVIQPIALGVTVVIDTFEFLKKSIELAGQEIEAFGKIAADAAGANVSTDFYQRFIKSAPQATLSIDQVTEALNNFNKASTDKLGGSDLQQRIDALTKAGNFSGNTGVSQLAGANDTETKLRAIVSLIDQAEASGQRLAALDIAGKAFGDPVRSALQADSGYLDQVLAKADSISKTQLVSQDDIGRVIQLKSQIDAAQQLLADKWKPIEADMAELGLNARDNWASVVTVFADLVGQADKLYALVKEIPDAFASFGNLSIWKTLTDLTGKLGLNSTPAGLETGIDVQKLDATNKLAVGLQNPANVRRAMQQTTETAYGAQKDTSKNTGGQSNAADAVQSAIDSLNKHVQATQADAKAVGLGAAALAEFRAQAQETAAIQKNGGEETADQAAKFKQLQAAAAAAAQALAVAQVNSNISRGEQTAFLTPEDLSIANQLKSIYGDNIPAALNSSYAAALKFNDAIKELGQLGQQVNEGFFTDFETQIRNGATAMQALQTAGVNALGAIADKLAKMAADNLWESAFGGVGNAGGLLGSLLGGLTGANGAAAAAKSANTLATNSGGAFFGPGFDGGGYTGAGGKFQPAGIVHKGEFVFDQSAVNRIGVGNLMKLQKGYADGGYVGMPDVPSVQSGGGATAITVHSGDVNIQGSADQTTLLLMRQELAKRDAELPGKVVQAVTLAKKRRMLS